MVGNSNSNINNVGFVAKAGEWIVYSNFDDNNYLYKMKADGSMKIKLAEVSCKYINISDDWIYYTDFWGVNIYITNINDGKTDIVVGDNYIGKHITNWVYDEVSEEISHLIVVDDWMNWTQFNGESLMCKNIFTYEEYRLRNRISYYLNMEGEWAFYLKEADCSYGPKMEFDMMYLGGIDNTMLDKANYKLSLKRISFEIPDIIFNFIVRNSEFNFQLIITNKVFVECFQILYLYVYFNKARFENTTKY